MCLHRDKATPIVSQREFFFSFRLSPHAVGACACISYICMPDLCACVLAGACACSECHCPQLWSPFHLRKHVHSHAYTRTRRRAQTHSYACVRVSKCVRASVCVCVCVCNCAGQCYNSQLWPPECDSCHAICRYLYKCVHACVCVNACIKIPAQICGDKYRRDDRCCVFISLY